MNLQFMGCFNVQERTIRQFFIVKHKLMSFVYSFVLLMTMNFVMAFSKQSEELLV